MTEQEFLDIRKSVFSNITKSSKEKADIERQIGILKQQQEKKLADYDKMNQAQLKDVNAKRSLVLEQYKLSIMSKQASLRKEEAYIERAQEYFKYIVALHSNNEKDMKTCKENFLEVIQKQALEECNTPISIIQQKRITANALNRCLDGNPNAQKVDSLVISKKELDDDRMKEFDLREQKELMEKAFQSEKPQLSDSFMRSQTVCDMPVATTVKNIYPNYKDQMLAKEERKGKAA